jgi:hypothetical protein
MLNYYLELQWPCLEMNFMLCNPTMVTQLFIISMDKIPIKFLKIVKKIMCQKFKFYLNTVVSLGK